jgi:hypothetical protein
MIFDHVLVNHVHNFAQNFVVVAVWEVYNLYRCIVAVGTSTSSSLSSCFRVKASAHSGKLGSCFLGIPVGKEHLQHNLLLHDKIFCLCGIGEQIFGGETKQAFQSHLASAESCRREQQLSIPFHLRDRLEP